MSIAVLIGVHDGLVLAADSASSLTVSSAPGITTGVANVYENANKIFNLYKGRPIGCIAFGSGSIGNSSIGTLLKDLREILSRPETAKEPPFEFDPKKYTMEQVARITAKFLSDECQKPENKAVVIHNSIGLLIGGYSTGQSHGESWSVKIDGGVAQEPKMLRKPSEPGISWGGQSEVLHRIVVGYSGQLFKHLSKVSAPKPDGNVPTAGELRAQLIPALRGLQAELVFAPMPIQDAIELGRFLVHSSVMFSRFLPGAQVVGGPIEIAAITKHEGFKWISRKHYYDRAMNVEPVPVVMEEPIHVTND